MTEPTEREQKLIEYVKFLINIISAQAWLINTYFKRGFKWYVDIADKEEWGIKQSELIDYLKSEFGVEYRKITDEDFKEARKNE